MKIYMGSRSNSNRAIVIRRNEKGEEKLISSRLDISENSPTGLEWGYNGSGPTQCALAILSDCLDDWELADNFKGAFRENFVSKWPHTGFEITESEIKKWIYSRLMPDDMIVALVDLFLDCRKMEKKLTGDDNFIMIGRGD